MSKRIKIICIGKIKKDYWRQAAETYQKRLAKFYSLQVLEIKDGPGHLAAVERMQVEASAIQRKTGPQDRLICLDRQGRAESSPGLATLLRSWVEDPGGDPCFVLGGAYGLTSKLLSQSSHTLSFGPMTLPHELARIVLLEQLYRATAIVHNHPYHH